MPAESPPLSDSALINISVCRLWRESKEEEEEEERR